MNVYSEFNMEILASRFVECGDWWRAENISSPFTRIYMVTSGRGYLFYKNKSVTMNPGNIYVIPAGLHISYHCDTRFFKTYFHVSIPLQNGFDLLEGIDRCFSFSDENTVTEVTRRLNSRFVPDIIYIKTALYMLVHRCIEGNVSSTAESYSDLTVKIMEYIEANLSSGLLIAHISQELHISTERLRRIFRADTGISVGKYISNRLMHKAELEVRRGEFSIKEISDQLGFCDQFYFSRCFSEKFGMSPSKYRKKINAKE